MSKIPTQGAACKMMAETYGRNDRKKCRYCCNLQPRERGGEKKVCIAFGDMVERNWDPECTGCGLYNIPFLALRPKHTPLFTYVPDEAENDDTQGNIFDIIDSKPEEDSDV